MPKGTDELAALLDAAPQPPHAVEAHTYHKKWTSASKPVLLECNDGELYVVKGTQNGRMIVNDRIVGLLGVAIEAPVGEVSLVDVPQELITAEPELQHMAPGISHGSLFVDGYTEKENSHVVNNHNRPRFAKLAILYGWVHPNDAQFIYQKEEPREVLSVDHSHFFPGGPEWKEQNLNGTPPAAPDHRIVTACGVTDDELRAAAQALEAVTDQDLAAVVKSVPVEWPLTNQERVRVVEFLARRRDQMLASVLGTKEASDE